MSVTGLVTISSPGSGSIAATAAWIAIVPEAQAARALGILRAVAPGGPPAAIGEFRETPSGRTVLRGVFGVERVLDRLSGEQLPRIC